MTKLNKIGTHDYESENTSNDGFHFFNQSNRARVTAGVFALGSKISSFLEIFVVLSTNEKCH